MSFGYQTLGFVTITETGNPGFLGIKEKQRSVELVHGCHFRQFESDEVVTETDTATEHWKGTCPAEAAVLAAKSTGEVLYDGTLNPADIAANTFQIDGPKAPKSDLSQVHHVTIFCKRQVS